MAEDRYSIWKRYIEEKLADFLPEAEQKSRILSEAMRYSLSAGGKRLRPLLLLEACSVCGGDAEKALPYACAVEFIHTYSLIHDDHPSMDDDDYRRGKLTNHKVFGDGMAILAGDGLLNSAFDVMMEDILPVAGRGEDVSFLLRAAYEISSSAGVRGMIAGQAADLQNTGNGYRQDAKFAGNLQGKRTTVRERCAAADSEAGAGTVREELSGGEEGREKMLLYIHKKKTGALIRAAVRAGALIAGASERQIAELTEYAENLGLAFQISDDILDVVGSEAEMGKRAGADQRLGKLTYPSVFGLEVSRRRLAEATERAVEAAARFGEDGGFLEKLAIDLQSRIS